MKQAILVDFDGTIMRDDLAELALRRFANPRWKYFNELLAEGKINVEESVTIQYAMIRANSQKEVISYLREHYHLRSGFRRLLDGQRAKRSEIVIVSAGLDFCIKDAFATLEMAMPRLICPKSRFSTRFGVQLAFPPKRFPLSKDFKEDSVKAYKRRGYEVAYVGDGAGDINAAETADAVFAIEGSTLASMCKTRRIAFTAVRSFETVARATLGRQHC